MTSRFQLEPHRPVDVYYTYHGKDIFGVMLTNPADYYPACGNIYGPQVLHGRIVQPMTGTEYGPGQPRAKAMVKLGTISAEMAEPFRREFLAFDNFDQWRTGIDFIKGVWVQLFERGLFSRQQYIYGWLMMKSCQPRDTDPEDHFHEVVEQCDGVIFTDHSTEIWKDGVGTTLWDEETRD